MTSGLILSRRLRASGDSTLGLERGVHSGRFVRIRPGAYLPAAAWAAMDAQERHRVAVEALAATARRPVVFAVESAALLHGIPFAGAWPTVPRVLVADRPVPRARVGTSPRWRPTEPDEVVALEGNRVTSPLRTAIDLAAERDLASGVMAFDDVMRRFALTREEAHARVERARPFRGARKVDAALAVATGLAESALESLSMLRIVELGFPRPQQQVGFVVDGETYRVDFYWPEHNVIGEADGLGKYTTRADLIREKQREDALRTAVGGFVRWDWSDAWAMSTLERKLQRAGLPRSRRSTSLDRAKS